MMRFYGELMASSGEFQDSNGRQAKRWIRCGVVMRDDTSGALSIKLEAVPVRPDWSGWLAVRNKAGEIESDPEIAGQESGDT